MEPKIFDYKDVFSKISGIARERKYEKIDEDKIIENHDLIKEQREILEQFQIQFPEVLDNELTASQRRKFIQLLKDIPEDRFIEEVNKFGDELEFNEDEKRVFSELLFIMKEQEGTMGGFMEELEDLIIDIKKSAYNLVVQFKNFVDENPILKSAAFATIIIPLVVLLFSIVIILVKEDGQDEIKKKLDEVM
jgi:hypothetical protein